MNEKEKEIENLQTQLNQLKNIIKEKNPNNPHLSTDKRNLNNNIDKLDNITNSFNPLSVNNFTSRIKSTQGRMGSSSIFNFENKVFSSEKIGNQINTTRNNKLIPRNVLNLNDNNNIDYFKNRKYDNHRNMISKNNKELVKGKKTFSSTFSNFFRKNNKDVSRDSKSKDNKSKDNKSNDNNSLLNDFISGNFNSLNANNNECKFK